MSDGFPRVRRCRRLIDASVIIPIRLYASGQLLLLLWTNPATFSRSRRCTIRRSQAYIQDCLSGRPMEFGRELDPKTPCAVSRSMAPRPRAPAAGSHVPAPQCKLARSTADSTAATAKSLVLTGIGVTLITCTAMEFLTVNAVEKGWPVERTQFPAGRRQSVFDRAFAGKRAFLTRRGSSPAQAASVWKTSMTYSRNRIVRAVSR